MGRARRRLRETPESVTPLVRAARLGHRGSRLPPCDACVRQTRQTGQITVDTLELISVDLLVCHGQACLKGTRIPVSVVLDCLGDGMSTEQIIEQHPSLTVRASAAYTAELARQEVLPLTGDR